MRRPNNLAIVTHRENLSPWIERLSHGILAVDTETTGTDWKEDLVGGVGFAAGDTAVYACRDALGPAAEWLGDQVKRERPLVGHNVKFDLHMMRATFGLRVSYPIDDTFVMSFLLDNRGAPTKVGKYGGHGLDELATSYVDPEAKRAEEELREAVIAAGGRRGAKTWKEDLLSRGPLHLVGKYGALDAWYTLQLYHQFNLRLDNIIQPNPEHPSLRSLYETEKWLLIALVEMEQRGVRVRPEFFEKWKRKLEKKRDATHQRLSKMAGGREINWNSAPQLRVLLYEKLGLTPSRWTKGGKKTGPQPSTDEVALLDLKHPIGAELLKLRDIEKQRSTYAEGLLNAIRDERIHANFKQTGARTGRLSCSDPNLQQVPRESGARRGFIPDEGLAFRMGDYSQVEMRFAAHESQDPVLIDGFCNDSDFDTHAATAKKMWGLSGAPTKQQRKFAKIMNFAMLFGAGEAKIASQLVSLLSWKEAKRAVKVFGHRLAPGEQPHRSLAQLLMKRYFTEFPAIKNAKYRATDEAERLGYTVNAFGRHRYLDENESYKAFNSVIQGSAADLSKRGLVLLFRELQQKDQSIALILQIHDEAMYLSDGDPRTDRRVQELLDDHEQFRVPMVSDIEGSSTSWQDKKTIEL